MDCSRLFLDNLPAPRQQNEKACRFAQPRTPENKHIVRTVSTLQHKNPFSLFFVFKNIKKRRKRDRKA